MKQNIIKKRYQAVARALANGPFKIKRKEAAGIIGRSLRQFYQILKRFKEEGISGLKFRSKRPINSPNKIPRHVEEKIVSVCKACGFGPDHIVNIVNESNRREGKSEWIYPSLAYNVLIRNGEIERERRLQKK